jgi:hypothetical protein
MSDPAFLIRQLLATKYQTLTQNENLIPEQRLALLQEITALEKTLQHLNTTTSQSIQDNAHVGIAVAGSVYGDINFGPDRSQVLNARIDTNYSFFQGRLDRFVGRAQELAEIRQRIEEVLPTGGYITIMGQAGQGKSCVIAKLVYDHLQQITSTQGVELISHPNFDELTSEVGHEQVIFHTIPLNPSQDHQVILLHNLIARICLKYDLPETYVASDSRPALKAYFAKALSEIAQKGKQELIYIDGLDQILPDGDGIRDLDFLPLEPPPGIVFVLGTRPNDTLQPLELRKPREPYLLPALSQSDFELILQRYQVNLAAVNIQRFYDAMDHNALYLDLVAQELQVYEASLDSKAIEDLITKLSSDPSQIFSLTIERLSQQERYWDKVLKPLLGYLLVAKSPLSADALRKLIVCDQNIIQTGLRMLGGLLTTTSDHRYTLYHLKLRDYLKEHFFAADEQQEFHKRLADWAWQGKGGLEAIWQDQKDGLEQERRVYAREHLIAQLADAQEYDRLWELIDAGDYGRAKLRFDPSTRSYALDLDYARQAIIDAGETLDEQLQLLPRFWKYSLLRTHLASRADAYPDELYQAMVQKGRLQEVIGLLELLNDQKRKLRLFVELSTLIADRTEIVQQMRNRALQLWHDLTSEERQSSIDTWFDLDKELRDGPIKLIPLLIEPYLKQASVQNQQNSYLYGRYYQLIADYYYLIEVDKAKEQEALQIIFGVHSSSPKVEILKQNYRLQIQLLLTRFRVLGRMVQIPNHASQSDYPDERSWAVRAIVEVLLTRGKIGQSQNHASQFTHPMKRGWAELAIVEALLARGEIEQAQNLISQFNHPIQRSWAELASIEALLARGEIEQAQNLVTLIGNPDERSWAVRAIIEARLTRGEIEQAQNLTSQFSDRDERSWAELAIVEALLAIGEIEQAQNLTSQFSDRDERSWAELAIVEALLAIGEIEQAQNLASLISHSNQRRRAERGVVKALLATGEVGRAQIMASLITHPRERSWAKRAVVDVLAQRGEFELAQQLASSITYTSQRSVAELSIVKALVQGSQFEEAKELASSIFNQEQQLLAEQLIVETLAQNGRSAEAKTHTDTSVQTERTWETQEIDLFTTNQRKQGSVKKIIVEALAQAGQFEHAKQIASSITDTQEQQSWAKNIIVTELTRIGKFEEARVMAASITDQEREILTEQTMLVALAKTGRFAEAKEIALSITNHQQQAWAKRIIVTELAQVGEFEQAKTLAFSITDQEQRLLAEQSIVKALVQAGEFEQAKTLAFSITDQWQQVWAKRIIAVILAQVGEFEQAKQIASSITDQWQQAWTKRIIVTELAQAGEFEQAKALASSITDQQQQWWAEGTIIAELAQAGEFEQAKALASSITDQQQQWWAKKSIMTALTLSGRPEEAFALASSITDQQQRLVMEEAIVETLVKVNDCSKAIIYIETLWFNCKAYEDLCSQFSFVKPLIATFPELGMQFAESFDWVDSVLVQQAAR